MTPDEKIDELTKKAAALNGELAAAQLANDQARVNELVMKAQALKEEVAKFEPQYHLHKSKLN